MLGRKFDTMESFFNKPIKSNELGIFKVKNYSKIICIWNIEDVVTKYMILKTNHLNCMVAYPIIHFNI